MSRFASFDTPSKLTTARSVSEVHPWIARDVENAQKIKFDEMLQSFLLDCAMDKSWTMQDAANVFKVCYKHTLAFCNGEILNGVDSGMIKDHLKT